MVQNGDIVLRKVFVPDEDRLPGVNSFQDTNKVCKYIHYENINTCMCFHLYFNVYHSTLCVHVCDSINTYLQIKICMLLFKQVRM